MKFGTKLLIIVLSYLVLMAVAVWAVSEGMPVLYAPAMFVFPTFLWCQYLWMEWRLWKSRHEGTDTEDE